MELLPTSEEPSVRAASFWRDPRAWFRRKNLGHGYWVFFSAAFFYDAGFSIYFFLFNLYLFDRGFNERTMGWIGGAMTVGSLVGTLPVGALARRIALRPLLAMIFVASAATNALRTVWVWEPAQIGLAFLTGLAMCGWGVCYLPAVARLTNERNRTSGFSLIFSVSIGTAMLGGVVCGYLRQWLGMAGIAMQAADVKRLILLVSCGIVLLGLIPVLGLRVPSQIGEKAKTKIDPERGKWLRAWKLRPFLLRFLPSMALWSAVLAAFTPFGNIYLARDLHISMAKIGLIFSAVQVVQFCMGLATPVVFRTLGLANGIAVIQIAAAVVLGSLAGVTNGKLAVALYLTFAAAQWMSLPGLYNLLMNETPDGDRSTASALMMFFNALAGSVATAAAGVLFTRFGYPRVLLGLAIVALAVALLLRFLIAPREASPDDDHDSGCSTLAAPSSCQAEVLL
jgi:predicted MFS family arabinose efflux permease